MDESGSTSMSKQQEKQDGVETGNGIEQRKLTGSGGVQEADMDTGERVVGESEKQGGTGKREPVEGEDGEEEEGPSTSRSI